MNKEIIYGNELEELIKNVVIKLCDNVGFTLGPKGRNAIIDTDYSEPFITNDGVTIAKNLEFSPREEVIAKIIKEASIKTCEKVGDGTTSSLVLLKSLYLEGLNQLKSGMSPYEIKELLDNETNIICEMILKNTKKIDLDSLKSITTISSGSSEIGELLSQAFKSVGINGKVVVEETNKENTNLKIIKGMLLDNGVVSSFMISNRAKKEIMYDVNILVTDNKINDISEIENILKEMTEKNLLIVADSYDEEVIKELSNIKSKGIVNIVCIEAPNYSENKSDILEDIAIYTGSKYCSCKYGTKINELTLNDLGNAVKVEISRDNTIIYSKRNYEVKSRIKYMQELLDKETNDYDKEILESRISSLSKGTAIIYVGAKTKSEMILNKMRIEDAVNAAKVSLKYGYSLGGGLTYYRISQNLNDNNVGQKILKIALKSVIEKIVSNCGIEPNVVLENIKNKNKSYGYDAKKNEYVNLEESGIIDSSVVLIEALKNAVSIAGVLLTTSLAIVVNNKKEEKNITEII